MRWGVCILGSQFAMEQRHITRVMFSAVVHQSRTVTAAVKKKGYIDESLFADARPGRARDRGRRTRALPGIGWGRQGRAWQHATKIVKKTDDARKWTPYSTER
jgi:hypothetical protein